MHKGLIILFATLMAGCASVGELRNSTPYATFTTTKSPQAVAECIRDAWQNQRIGIEANGASLQQTGSAFTVVSPASGLPYEVADVSPDGRISVYAQKSIDIGGRKIKRADSAKNCI